MYSLTIEKENGEQLELTNNEINWQIAEIEGLGPSDGEITTKELANWDGAVYVDSRVESRDITIEIYLNNNVEDNRLKLYDYFKPSKYIKLYFETENRKVYIIGYVEKIKLNHFDKHQVMQVSINCPNPYFMTTAEYETKLANSMGGFYFPFSIDSVGIEFTSYENERAVIVYNYGEISTGARFVLTFNGEVVNPAIYNRDTGEYIRLIKTFSKGEEIEINTIRGLRGITKLNDNTNLIKYIDINTTWLQLESGRNYFSLKADTGVNNLVCTIYNNIFYQGI